MNKVVLVLFPIALVGIIYVFYNALFAPAETTDQTYLDFSDIEINENNVMPPSNTGVTMQTKLRTGETITVSNLELSEYNLGDNETFVLTGVFEEANPRYALIYYATYDFYQISIEAEPLGENRLLAEQALQTALGISEATMCQLDISVRTHQQVNQYYAGQELGLSYCPGSIPLN